jgi:uroporphyrin-III C-methyltransferase/precorrin-2 dehydrogenase/sirohydrochlorin ferrochelatase
MRAKPCSRLPLFVDLRHKRVLVVGGGKVAASKLPSLLATGAQVTLVAPQVIPAAKADGVSIRRRCFRDADLDGVWFVIAAATPATNARVARAAKRRRVFVNAVDDPVNASAYFAATVKRGDFVLALSTTGTAPAMARLMREALEALLPEDIDEWLALAKGERERWLRDKIPMSDRLPLLVAAILARHGLPPVAQP